MQLFKNMRGSVYMYVGVNQNSNLKSIKLHWTPGLSLFMQAIRKGELILNDRIFPEFTLKNKNVDFTLINYQTN